MESIRALLPRLTLRQLVVLSGIGVVLGAGGIATAAVLIFLGARGGTLRPAPEQPIAFDHVRHAGELGIPCEFCHRGVETQAAATIPSLEQCMFCHTVVGKENPEVQLLAAHWEEGRAVDWVRVHRLPDHVRFVHEAHILAGLECSTCHGEVPTMKVVKQVENLNMGMCMACHREMSASLDCATCHK